MARPEPPTSEVDRLAAAYERYDTDPAHEARWSPDNPGNRAIHDERATRMAALLGGRARPGRVLEIGCGRGQVLAELPPGTWTSPVIGIDLSAARLAAAASRLPGGLFVQGEGSALPLPSSSVSTVLACTLFSSLLDDALAGAVASEMARVLEPGGTLVWYDLRRGNPANPDVRPLRRPDVQALFPGWSVDLAPVTVLPPLVRRLGPVAPGLYPLLARVRPLTTHLLGVVAKPG